MNRRPMSRRSFVRLLASVGMVAVTPFPRRALAQSAPSRHFIFVHAGGGWDPTALCDPKGETPRSDGRGPVNHYYAADIGGVAGGPIRYAPFPHPDLATSMLRQDMPVAGFDDFFQSTGRDLLVINGIDTLTNNHDTGTRTVWAGFDTLGMPAAAALIAQAYGADSPMAFITNGGYDEAAGLVAPTRVGGTAVFSELAYPERYRTDAGADPADESTYYLHPDVYAQVQAMRRNRMQRLAMQSRLPLQQQAVGELLTVSTGDNSLGRLVEALPPTVSGGLRGQAELALAAFRAQVAVSANLTVGGFDTHSQTDRDQTFALAQLVDGLRYLHGLIQAQGLAERVTVLVGSDFGRTPFYNDDAGKDHWNVTSMLAFGAGVRGNRVIGGTTPHYEALKVDRTTLQPAADQDAPGAVRLTCAEIHRALRRLAGVEDDAAVRRYGLVGEDLAIFS